MVAGGIALDRDRDAVYESSQENPLMRGLPKSGSIQFVIDDDEEKANTPRGAVLFEATLYGNLQTLAQELSQKMMRDAKADRDRALEAATPESRAVIQALKKFGRVHQSMPESAIRLLSLIPEKERDANRVKFDVDVFVPFMCAIASNALDFFTAKLKTLLEARVLKSVYEWGPDDGSRHGPGQ